VSDNARKVAQLASIAVCAAALLGAVVFIAPRGHITDVQHAPVLVSMPPVEGAPPPQLSAPMAGRSAVQDVAAEVAPAPVPAGSMEDLTLRGWVVGDAPGHGQAWAVEAYRLTQDRTAVLESRRWYVEPDGRLSLTDLGPGLWQTALISPRFAWGPLVDTARPPAALRLGEDGTGQICVNTVTDGAAPRGVRLRISLTAVRSPSLEGALVSVNRRLAPQEIRLGQTLTLEGVSGGTYEVTASLAGVESEWGLRPRSRSAQVTVRPGTTHVELAFVDQTHAAQVSTEAGNGKAAAFR